MMILKRAIEIGHAVYDANDYRGEKVEKEALKIVLEAAEREQNNRDDPDYVRVGWLPSETKD